MTIASLLQVDPRYAQAGFALAQLDETESSGNVNDSVFAFVLTVSPAETRRLTNINFVDHVPKGSLVFTRNLTKTCVNDELYSNYEPEWPEQRQIAWDRPTFGKQTKFDFSPADYLEACTPDQLNYHLFELSKIRKFTAADIHRIFVSWRLAGLCSTDDMKKGDVEGDERMLNLQVAGRVVIPNHFDGPAIPSKQRHLFLAMRFVQMSAESDTFECQLMEGENGYLNIPNVRPKLPDLDQKSLALFPTTAEFVKRLIPRVDYMCSFYEYPPSSDLTYEIDGVKHEALYYPLGHVVGTNSFYDGDLKPNTTTTISDSTSIKKNSLEIHANLKLF